MLTVEFQTSGPKGLSFVSIKENINCVSVMEKQSFHIAVEI